MEMHSIPQTWECLKLTKTDKLKYDSAYGVQTANYSYGSDQYWDQKQF